MRLIDADALSEKLCETTIFIKDGEVFQRMINDAPTVSAEAKPTVIRIRTLMTTKDFKEWAKRVREENPNVIVIPCEAEVVSAEAVKVAYICDGRKCDGDCSDCFRTLDIEHAKDFKLMGSIYFQQESAEAEWIPCDGKLPNKVGDHVLVTIKWADDDLEVCEMCPTSASRYNIVAYQKMPTPYKGGDSE